MTNRDLELLTGRDVRHACRSGTLTTPTASLAPGFVQANLVVLPSQLGQAFAEFCNQNSKPCPLLETIEHGSFEPVRLAPGADLRTDLPKYRVYENGTLSAAPHDIRRHWRPDLFSFLIGCSFSFERALHVAGIPVRHWEESCNVSMYRTSIACKRVDPFHGPLVVSMRPMTPRQAESAERITKSMPFAHGGPVHWGDPAAIGIKDLQRPDFGDPVTVHPNEIPIFWACGVTSEEAVRLAAPEIAITHEPGHMFITDQRDDRPQDS